MSFRSIFQTEDLWLGLHGLAFGHVYPMHGQSAERPALVGH